MPGELESLKIINTRLINHFGIDSNTGNPIWRIVFSDDQVEKRKTWYTKEGFKLLTPEIVELPKYRQWIQGKYILEQLVAVPPEHDELAVGATSYEPIFVFEDATHNALPVKWEVAKFAIDCVYAAMGRSNLAKYKPDAKEENAELRIAALEEELFGNETDITDALAYKEGVTVPSNFVKLEK